MCTNNCVMSALLPPDFENAIVISYSSGKAVVSQMPEEASGVDHDYYLLCHAIAVCATLFAGYLSIAHEPSSRFVFARVAGNGQEVAQGCCQSRQWRCAGHFQILQRLVLDDFATGAKGGVACAQAGS